MLSNSLCVGGELGLDGSSSVSKELGVNTLEGSVPLSLRFVNTIAVSLLVLVVSRMVLGLGHFN